MGNSLRCCLACILPCGALDVVRVVHLSGHVEEFGRPVAAGEILAANPNHILTKPCSLQGATAQRILIVSPDSTLRRGSIYFLIPESSSSLQERRRRRKKKRAQRPTKPCRKTTTTTTAAAAITGTTATAVEVSDDGRGFTEVIGSEKKKPGHRRRRSGRVAIWQPRLESITEDL
ncbi:hypothetical protein Taro_047972 [Colocasia esculenta]|uniref:Uncharacterized protein n=1 Tax=Colocasia esculenta TaxID=4460 RepID=A0A843X1V9_COLES|nr:hypothetical protein [Colocasia esculenta]